MQRVLSTYLFSKRKLIPALLAEVERARIPAIEVYCTRPHWDYYSPQDARELADTLATHHLTLHSLHAPMSRDSSAARESALPLSICDPERVRRLDAVDEVKRALDVAEIIPFRFLVQHMGTGREPLEPRYRDAAFSSLEHLMLFAKQRGVTIALENTPGEMGAPAALRQFIQETRLQELRLCFDLGHAHLGEGVAASLETMRELVVTTHVHDNHGEKDEHLLPYEGTIDWKAALKTLPAELPIVLELKEPAAAGGSAELSAFAETLRGASAVFDKFEHALTAKA